MRQLAVALWFLCVGLAGLRAESAAAPESFFEAIESGDISVVTRQLDAGISPNARGKRGVTALYLACDKTQPAIAELLIARGADVNLTPPHGSSPLQVSIYRGYDSYKLEPRAGYPELIQTLLAKGANVNSVDVDGNSPLIAAAEKDDIPTLDLLLARGADLGHANNNGWTALDRAVAYRRRTIAHKLVRLGAPLDQEQREQYDRYEWTRKVSAYFPLLLVGGILLAGFLHRQFKALPKRTDPIHDGDNLPKLEPLKCAACGGRASLRPGVAKCSRCHSSVSVPEDYTETLRLRAQTIKLSEKAVHLWKRVRLVSMPPVRWLLWLAAIAFVWWMWKGLFPLFVRDALYNLMTFGGTMAWLLGILTMSAISIALAGYAIYLFAVRSEMPAPPGRIEKLGEVEVIDCPGCAGKVEIDAGQIVGICGYCGSEAYRTALARESRGVAAKEKDAATASLYQAMVRVYELRENAALAIPAAVVFIGCSLAAVLWVILAVS